MIEINVLKNDIRITERESITSGSVNAYKVHFHFNSHWDGLEKVAVFRTASKVINVPIENDVCVIPWEVMTTPGVVIDIGVYGIKALQIVLPTIWARLATVVEGVFIGDAESGDHTPDVYDAILGKIEDLLRQFQSLKDDVNVFRDDIPTDDEIFMIIDRYLKKYPPTVDQSTMESLINNYFQTHPIEGVTEERVQEMINASVGAAISSGY